MFDQGDAYERFMGRWSRLLAPSFVSFASVGEAASILDVGSGTGALLEALLAATTSARITGVDVSPAYVGAARRISDPRVEVRVGDASALEFGDATFGAALSALALNFVPDFERAAREMVRVTEPGGVIAVTVWDYGDGMQMLRAFWDEAVALDPAARALDEARMPLARDGELGALLRAAGAASVTEAPLTIRLRFASFDDYWSPFLLGQGPAGAYASALGAHERARLEARLRSRLLAGDDAPFELEARAWAARGLRP